MSITTVSEFANELRRPTEALLEQLKSAGVPKAAASDTLTDADKHKLLAFLQGSHGAAAPERKKITLVKKQTTEIKQADASGRARTIQVEVRKKRTFVKRDEGSEAVAEEIPAPAEPQVSAAENAELIRREEEASRSAELLRVKGLLNVDGEPVAVHAVQTLIHEPVTLAQWPDAERRSRLVFITRGMDREALVSTLEVLRWRSVAPAVGVPKPDPQAYARFLAAMEKMR